MINPNNVINLFVNCLYQNLNEENLNQRLRGLINNNINILNNNNARQYILNGIRNRDDISIQDRNNLADRINNIFMHIELNLINGGDNLLNIFMNYLYENINQENVNQRLNDLINNNRNILNDNNIRDYIMNGIQNRDNVDINDRNNLVNHINNIMEENVVQQ